MARTKKEGPASVSARVAANGTSTEATFTGFGVGGHKGTLRLMGDMLDRAAPVVWDGDRYTAVARGARFASGVATVDGVEYRFEVEPL